MLIAYLIVTSSQHNPPQITAEVIISIEKHAAYVVIVRIKTFLYGVTLRMQNMLAHISCHLLNT